MLVSVHVCVHTWAGAAAAEEGLSPWSLMKLPLDWALAHKAHFRDSQDSTNRVKSFVSQRPSHPSHTATAIRELLISKDGLLISKDGLIGTKLSQPLGSL